MLAKGRVTQPRIRVALLVIGMAGMTIAVIGLRNDIRGQTLPSVATMAVALVTGIASLVFAARAWISLLGAEKRDRRAVSNALWVSQLSKYVPGGGLFQATGQITLSAAAHRSAKRVTIAFAVSAVSQAAAGCVIASGLAFVSGAPGWARWLGPLGLLTPLALTRPVLTFGMRIGRRITRHVPDVDHLPPPRWIAKAFCWGLLNIGCYGISYGVILHALDPDTSIPVATCAFAVAWVVGFLVLPIPSGLGIREAVLYAVLPGVPAGAVLASSLAHRLTTFIAEVILTAFSQMRRKHHPTAVETEMVVPGG